MLRDPHRKKKDYSSPVIRHWILGSWHQQKIFKTFSTHNRYRWSFDQFSAIKVNRTFPGMFGYIPWNAWQHSPESLVTLPEMFEDIPRNVWLHSPECLVIFSGIFKGNSRNVWWYSPEYLRTFPGMFGDTPRNWIYLRSCRFSCSQRDKIR